MNNKIRKLSGIGKWGAVKRSQYKVAGKHEYRVGGGVELSEGLHW